MRLSSGVLPSASSLPRDCSYWMQQLVEAWKQGDSTQCRALAQKITTDFPEEGLAWKLLGSLYQQENQLTLAAAAFLQAGKMLKKDAEVFYNLANVYAQLQEHSQAIKFYRLTLKLSPAFSRAYANWAGVLKQTGQMKEAEKLLRRGLNIHQQDGRVNFELATLLHEADKPLEAIQYYREAMAIEPENPIIYFNMAVALELLGNESEAIHAFETAIAHQPDYVEAYSHLGALYLKKVNFDEAEQWLLAGHAVNAQDLSVLKNLAKLYRVTQRTREYQQYVDQIMRLQDFSPEQLNNVAAELLDQNLYAEAERYCLKALEQDSGNPYIYGNLGLIENARSAFDKACLNFEKALEILPESEVILSNYSISLRMLGRYAEAIASLEKAIALKPDHLSAYINLSSIYLDLGKAELAIEMLEKVLAQDPDHVMALRNLLFSDSYVNLLPEQKYAAYVQKLGQRMMLDKTPFSAWQLHKNDQRLRVGIVSADLRRHPVGYFLENWLKHFNPAKLEIYAYSTDGREDVLTHELKSYCNQWRSLAGLTDEQAAGLIHDDGIHILLDLSGLTGGTRLPIFAWKPAPVQAAWLGYWGTTGLPAMDYVIADPVSVDAQVASRFTEQVAYLPHTRMCFTAPPFDIAVNALPARQSGHITFGCYQNYTKVTDEVFTLWGQIFQQIPNAKLRWQCKAFNDDSARAETLHKLARLGMVAERCELLGMVTRDAYLKSHHEVDMILDSFPFSGGTTTCEALWMGVPTLTLLGNTLIGRQGASMLSCAGLSDWVAETHEQYIEKAVLFASDLEKLAATRHILRANVLNSPLMNAAQFAEDFEALMFTLWQQAQSGFKSQQLLASTPIQTPFTGEQPVWVVSATRMDEETFWRDAALGRSLKRHMRQDKRLVAKIACDNKRGLSEIFNEAIETAPDNALLVFIHDDVWIDENNFVQTILDGLEQFDVIGVAGNARIQPAQPGWCFTDTQFTWDDTAYLRGAVSHGQHAFGPASIFGEITGSCQLMDGVFTAAHKQTLIQSGARYDKQFDFEFYDLDFCRTAVKSGLKLGTWSVRMTHQSGGNFGKQRWLDKYQLYMNKWERQTTSQNSDLNNAIEEVFDLALSHHQQGEHEHAARLYQEIVKASPQHALAIHNLGLIAWAAGEHNQALAQFETAYLLAPQTWQLVSSFLTALAETGNTQHFQEIYQQVFKQGLHTAALETLVQQWNPSASQLAGSAPPEAVQQAVIDLFAQQQYAEMTSELQTLLKTYPAWLTGWKMLADICMIQKLDAREPARQALALNAQDPKEHCYYGIILKAQGDFLGAADAFQQAITLNPAYAAAYNNLGIVLKDLGRITEAITQFKQALALQPDYADCFSNLLFCMTHAEGIDSAALMQAHQSYADLYETPLQAHWLPHSNTRDLNRPLKIGWVSADFRAHSVAHFLLPLLPELAQNPALRLFAYANHALADEVTAQMQGYFEQWREVSTLSDELLAEQIRQDGIDILIDLSGHTSGNRLLTFARKPAPVQLSWLGYLNSTGLSAIDYYLADPYLLPAGQFDHQFSEKLVQLPVNATFTPFAQAPEINDLPALKNGFITFGCFNRLHKITPSVVQHWAALMQHLLNSRIIIGGTGAAGSTQHLQQWFADAGIDSSRISFLPRADMQAYLQQYHAVDICLDTFPSNGVTTTAHALWMGVPTLCIAGDRLASRGAMALMQHAGLQAFIADNKEAFLNQGMALCADFNALATLRQGLRQVCAGSVLTDARAQAEHLITALHYMWQRWCEQLPAESFCVTTETAAPFTEPSLSTEPSTQGNLMSDQAIPRQGLEMGEIARMLEQAADCLQSGEVAQSQQLYEQVLCLDAAHAYAHHQLGFIKTHTIGIQQAFQHFETALQQAPENEQFWVSYIDALVMLGDTNTAEMALKQGLNYGLTQATADLLRHDLSQQTATKHAAQTQRYGLPAQASSDRSREIETAEFAITTLIPAYKTEYLMALLLGLATQTFKRFRVILSDDSPENRVSDLIAKLQESGQLGALKIDVVTGPKKGSFANVVHLLNCWNATSPLVHVLFDDDVIYPAFYESHVQAHLAQDLSASVSYRWVSNEAGMPVTKPFVPSFIDHNNQRVEILSAEKMFKSTIPHCLNWLGEFSNTIFSRPVAQQLVHQTMADIPYHGLGDIGLLLQGALSGNTAIIKEALGFFRTNPHQNTGNLASVSFQCGYVAWIALALAALKQQQISVAEAEKCVEKVIVNLEHFFAGHASLMAFVHLYRQEKVGSPAFEAGFMQYWHELLAGDIAWMTSLQLKTQQLQPSHAEALA